MTIGRPLKFETPELLQASVDDYFAKCEANSIPPTITGLAIHLGTFRDVLCDYENKDAFSNTIKAAKHRIEHAYELRLINRGNSGDIFALKNFGWKDQQDINHSGSVQITGLGSLLAEQDGDTKGI